MRACGTPEQSLWPSSRCVYHVFASSTRINSQLRTGHPPGAAVGKGAQGRAVPMVWRCTCPRGSSHQHKRWARGFRALITTQQPSQTPPQSWRQASVRSPSSPTMHMLRCTLLVGALLLALALSDVQGREVAADQSECAAAAALASKRAARMGFQLRARAGAAAAGRSILSHPLRFCAVTLTGVLATCPLASSHLRRPKHPNLRQLVRRHV